MKQLLFAIGLFYILNPVHGAINIDLGRQLFVDDFLIASTNAITRHWNAPVKIPAPVVRPTSEKDGRIAGCTVATDGGLWWDPTIGKYRLWYEKDWAGVLCYAESRDGITWEHPELPAVKGTNRVFSDPEGAHNKSLDSWSVWPDYNATNPYANWKLFISEPGAVTPDWLYTSSDGLTFTKVGLAGYSGDRSTLHFDSLLKEWVFSLRDGHRKGRSRRFHSQKEFQPDAQPYGFPHCGQSLRQGAKEVATWAELDTFPYKSNESLYNFDAVPYESIMLGAMEILSNTPRDNYDAECAGLPKQTYLHFAFSRDGRSYCPAAIPAISPSGWGSGKWDTGYISAIGGLCTVSDDTLRFYYSALRGDATKSCQKIGRQPMYKQGMYYNGSIGYATLRRDGFAGLVADGIGEIVTKPVVFSGTHLFVNAECLMGEVTAEILDSDGKVLPGFSRADCRGLTYADSCKRRLTFAGGDLSSLTGREVSIRFNLYCATLYSFWVSPSEKGESRGYVAAGGPDYRGLRDL